MRIRLLVNNNRGVTLLEILTAILIFILASVFIISLLISSLDKPKQAGVVQDLNSYEQSAQLLLKEIPLTKDTEYIKTELNNNLETNSKFLSAESTSTKLNAYNNPYNLDILQDSTQTAIIISTIGKTKSDVYELIILREGKTVESCTNGFARTDQKLVTLDSTLCTKTASNNTNENGTVAPPEPDNTSVKVVPEGYIGIYNDVDLNNVRNDLKANYIVMAEIDLTSSPFNTDANGWEPLGSYSVHFEGIFDGNNHTISNLRMNRTTDTYAGLFVGAKSALIKDLTLSSVNVGSDWNYGVLFSTSTNSTLDSIKVDGTLSTYDESSAVGGLIGVSNGDNISNSTTDIDISNPSAHGAIGGLIGKSTDTIITDSNSIVAVPTGTYVGGIVGNATRTTLTNTSANVALEGYYTGGLVGLSTLGIITSSSTEGTIKNSNQGAGLIGRDTSGIIRNSTSSVNVESVNAGGLLGTSIDSILSDVSSSGTITTNSSSSYAGGIIAFASKSTINNSKTLTNAYSSSKLITMGNTGGLLGASTESNIIIDNSYFTGDITSSGSYTGGIAGSMGGQILNSYSTGLISATNTYTGGLVGSLKGTMDNSHYTGDIVSTAGYTGGLAGTLLDTSTILNSFSSGTVKGINDVGGIAGNNSGTVLSSYTTSTITGSNNIGGLVGYNTNIVISSYANNSVTGVVNVGGLVGYADSSSNINKTFALGTVTGVTSIGGLVGTAPFGGSISNSYATGIVTNTSAGKGTGGFIGNLGAGVTFANVYSTGKVVSTGTSIGGLIGVKSTYSTLTSSYYDKTTSGKTDTTKGTPKTTAEMYQQATFLNWDFTTIWLISEGSTYPTLR